MSFTFYSFDPIHREEDAYKNANKCLHKQLTPTMYSCKFPGKKWNENFSPYGYITAAEDICS
ncbi:hypothetical protein PAHAL_5G037500 [Panicum hallii]|jgi:hypothetical protein|uniref:Uncharacterized protein n=1 Tax=Panicum hallii TaxID=206008 RepID=A0A2T8IIZ1_9POAL|nr:hypothetical protein PAHAL_5G037500 [Panicum hallii]